MFKNLSYKSRRRWALVILLVWLPLYLILAWGLLGRLALWQLPTFVEFVIYVIVGVIWVVPLKPVFKGIGQADPDAPDQNDG